MDQSNENLSESANAIRNLEATSSSNGDSETQPNPRANRPSRVQGRVSLYTQVIASVGVICAICFGVSQSRHATSQFELAKKQYDNDRRDREADRFEKIKPFLAIETSHVVFSVEPRGNQYDFVRDSDGVALDAEKLPKVRNYGIGPAFDVSVQFMATSSNESREGIPVVPLHVFPNAVSKCPAIPNQLVPEPDIFDDFRESKLFIGVIEISCRDSFGRYHTFQQKVKCTITTSSEKAPEALELHMDFGEIVLPDDFWNPPEVSLGLEANV